MKFFLEIAKLDNAINSYRLIPNNFMLQRIKKKLI